jgi:hypothetical protein
VEVSRHNESEFMYVCLSTEVERGRGRGKIHSLRKG